ncbi:uncharacterized protein LOC115989141 [Quercus lobata]|uniref:uncharacterized protein LOC115989141 n=1 Tax=Quercus lobata TaxID=97700 RepID=UPI001245EC5C|nr:uncharacterized protein LOC115989141 [Quercus lobata]
MTMIPRRTTILNRHFRKLKWSMSQSLLSLMMEWMKNLDRLLANLVSVKLLLLRIMITRMSLPKMQPQPRRLTQTQKRKNRITHKKRKACQTRKRSYNGGCRLLN